jgi:aminoglycoside/choline kinase family phosphotransferase
MRPPNPPAETQTIASPSARVAVDAPLPEARALQMASAALGVEVAALEPMPGGASSRRYYRARVGDRSVIVMFAPEGARPDEVSQGAPSPRWPFLEVRALLASRGVRVPNVLAEDLPAGLLVLEDLGDLTLAEALRRDPSRRPALYRRAAIDLAGMHAAMSDGAPGTVVASRRFDEALLRWELAHFVEWGLDARDVSRSAASRAALDEAFDALAKQLAAAPLGFVHRDYQSRNLMLDPTAGAADALVVIDFQDALIGPRAYDLVALLRDSYQDIDEAFAADVIATYAASRGMDASERAALAAEVDRLTVQRKLKDAGRFVFIERRKGDPSFLPYVAPSLRRVRGALERLGPSDALFARIHALLAEALPDAF